MAFAAVPSRAPSLWRRPGAGLVGILLIGLNLRIALVGVAPLIEQFRRDTGMSSAVAGMLTTIPFVCMAVFGLLGAAIIARLGTARLITWSLAVIAAGTLVRAGMPWGSSCCLPRCPSGWRSRWRAWRCRPW